MRPYGDCSVLFTASRYKCWRLLLCCFLLAELDCQSKLFFSSVAVFPFCNRRGALSRVQSKKPCLLQIRVQKWSKTGRNVSNKGFKTLHFGFKSNMCSVQYPSHCVMFIFIDIHLAFFCWHFSVQAI